MMKFHIPRQTSRSVHLSHCVSLASIHEVTVLKVFFLKQKCQIYRSSKCLYVYFKTKASQRQNWTH